MNYPSAAFEPSSSHFTQDSEAFCVQGTMPPPSYPRYSKRPASVYSFPEMRNAMPDSYLFNGATASCSTDPQSNLLPWSLGPLEFLLSFHSGGFFPDQESVSLEAGFSPTPSDSSAASTDTHPSPAPDFTHVVCNAPLVAPVPLPYHSPKFLQYDLPDDDEDLSHPPYTSRPHKRKREELDADPPEHVPAKRRSVVNLASHAQFTPHYSVVRHPPLYGPHPGVITKHGRPR
ncbi:hypothetical protein AcW1_005962 [Taiwanofungus camphoratus]|nr:hypothetical protein AcW2_004715 [Antrodia cinnamomea]KAI0934438.1 hypothetical protein AcV5_006279 [Antrodia cinnamomea]KAI0950273.1 hypothetical protein AcV7_008794 [Antrodia cinnamomea]KAI0957636.1 hypothetical protein AcW1_005962 [Antrodia cinnamomea]